MIAADSVVTGDIPAYHIAGGNPCRVIRKRFDDALIVHLLKLRWWDWDAEKISDNLEALCSGDPGKIMAVSYTHLDVYKRQVESPIRAIS